MEKSNVFKFKEMFLFRILLGTYFLSYIDILYDLQKYFKKETILYYPNSTFSVELSMFIFVFIINFVKLQFGE